MSVSMADYPWAQLESIPRSALCHMRTFRQWGEMHADLAAIEQTCSLLFEEVVSIRFEKYVPSDRIKDVFTVSIASTESTVSPPHLLLTLERQLLGHILARLLKRPLPLLFDPEIPLTPRTIGAGCALILHIARRAARGRWIPLTAEESSPNPSLSLGNLSALFSIRIGSDLFFAQVLLSPFLSIPRTSWNRRSLATLGDLPLSLQVLIGSLLTTRQAFSSLQPGQLLFRTPHLQRVDDFLSGSIFLSAFGSEHVVNAELFDRKIRVLQGASFPSLVGSSPMPHNIHAPPSVDPAQSDPIADALADSPIALRIELGTAELPAREWAELSGGDVITLGQPVGSTVILRVGHREVGRGELVDVEGELGVRVVQKNGMNATELE